MLQDLEGRWTDLLASNNITGIIRELRKILEYGRDDLDETLSSFSSWLQRTSEFTKKELLSLCFSRCQGLWMFLNHHSSRRIQRLLQKLRNLLTLHQWPRRKLHPGHCCHDYNDTSSNTNRRSWIREQRDLEKHQWLGRLVEWWRLMGLLPERPEVQGQKQIAHMWKEMSQDHRTSGMADSDTERCSSLIQGLVTHLVKQHGRLWTPESSGQQCYPPPSLKTLLRLVLLPYVDSQSVHAIIMYFILDIASILKCRNDLFKSFCNSFIIPPSFSLQIRAFWMLDHGQTKTAMDLLLSPRTGLPHFSWQHRYIIKSLLLRKEHQTALQYMYLTSPAVETLEDVKLSVSVYLQNSCVSEAWALVKRSHRESEDTVGYFLKACDDSGLSKRAAKCIPPGYESQNDICRAATDPDPCPLSAVLFRAQRERGLSSEEILKLSIQAVVALKPPTACKLRVFTWPQREHQEAKAESSEVLLSTEMPNFRSPSPSIVEPRADHGNQADNPGPLSSSAILVPPVPSSRRRVSFSSVSSLSPIRKDQSFSYDSTVTLQQISALLTDEQGEEDELSQVSATAADVFPEYYEQTLQHSHTPHSFRSRFYSTDCVSDLPSLPEEIIQTPTKTEESKDTSELFQESEPGLPKALLPDELQKEECEVNPAADPVSLEVPPDPQLNVEAQIPPSHRPEEDSVSSSARGHVAPSLSSVLSSQLHSLTLSPYAPPPKHREGGQDGKLADIDYAARRHSTGKVSVRSSRKNKNVR